MASEQIPEETNQLSIVICSDDEIQELNSRYRGKDSPTDVLSFSQLEGREHAPIISSLGDVIISVDTAQKQANNLGVSLEDEILRLLIHGTLHLFGYDHENVPDSEAERMRLKEEDIFQIVKEDS